MWTCVLMSVYNTIMYQFPSTCYPANERHPPIKRKQSSELKWICRAWCVRSFDAIIANMTSYFEQEPAIFKIEFVVSLRWVHFLSVPSYSYVWATLESKERRPERKNNDMTLKAIHSPAITREVKRKKKGLHQHHYWSEIWDPSDLRSSRMK